MQHIAQDPQDCPEGLLGHLRRADQVGGEGGDDQEHEIGVPLVHKVGHQQKPAV